MKYWLFKSEPSAYSWEDLKNEAQRTVFWDGVRNYQARNLLRDEVKKGDLLFFYHSVAKPQAIVGIARVVKEASPDPTAFDPESDYFDPKSDPQHPRWYGVEIMAIQEFNPPITRDELKKIPQLENMMLLKKGSRLSIQPVTEEEWQAIIAFRRPIDL
ncbi:Uncharacterized protein family UPF0310 [Caldithrix abyssi DSM 13497]|uniref:Putative RNA-binding protein, contains PUA-like domain n=1 Tax=Caldithrix abyssi DSM 13497 TaxID=880073 RepID=H1XWT8_CALAY|nr:EVE domain-containing protein [Caldithrix abyssi]APF19139.1 putative RNA-binding protein, contains PUA-like domain [Caldithrix abyssi DSM 13497]EHO43064.1 Uncharacterized protein family UPF0310 [Caldithrix abyssi DSM 13497]